MTKHVCDPSDDPTNTPVTRVRTLRLVAAFLDRNHQAIRAGYEELGNCPKCLLLALQYALGVAVAPMTNNRDQARMSLELGIAAAEAELRDNP